MEQTIALVQSRTFWSSLLAFVAIVAAQFHWDNVLGFATDPSTVTNILTLIGLLGVVGGGVFRTLATKRIVSALPPAAPTPPSPKLQAQAWLALLPLLALLSGCAQWQAITGIASSTVNPNYAAAAIQAFDAAETVADGYLKLPACVAGGAKVCRSKAAVAAIVPAVRTGRAARDAVQSALAASNGGPIAVASYNNLESVVTTLQAVYTNYNIALPANVTGN